MSVNTTAALSFGADPLPPRPVTTAQKTEARTKAEQARLDALPVQVRAWSDRLDLDDLECMGEVARRYRQEGLAPFTLHTSDLAQSLGTTVADAEERLGRLQRAGAVIKQERIAAAPIYRPVARGGDPVTVTGKKGEARAFTPAAPGSLMGLRRRD